MGNRERMAREAAEKAKQLEEARPSKTIGYLLLAVTTAAFIGFVFLMSKILL